MKITGPALTLLPLVLACADNVSLPTSDELSAHRPPPAWVIAEGDQEAPPGVPPEYQVPTAIHSIEPEAGWRNDEAYAEAVMRYAGNAAELVVTLTTENGSAPPGRAQDSHVFPLYYADVQANARLRMSTCRGTIRADAVGSVWNEAPLLGFPQWGKKVGSRSKDGACPTPATTTMSTSLTSNDEVCYTIITDHYWYYVSTNEFVFVRREYEEVCMKRTEYEL